MSTEKELSSGDAFALIKAALESQAIKLAGSHATEDAATRNGKSDAMYILTLFRTLQQGK